MSSSSPSTNKGKGKGSSERKKRKRRQQRHQHARGTETAPHILAALEAQRARVLQQPVPTPSTSAQPTTSAAAPTPPPPPPLPGYVFDAARNRFFRMVKDPLGTPRSASKSSGVSTYNRTGTRPKIAIPIVGVRNGGYGMPPRRGGGAGLGAGARGSRKNSRSNDNDSMGSIGPYAAACGERPTVVAAVAGSAARLSRRTRGVRGLHAYAMSRRRGLCCLDSGTLGSRGGFCRVARGGPGRQLRAGLESIVSSSRFRLRDLPPWAHATPGGAYSAIDWDADRNLLAVGTVSGALGVMATGLESASGGGDRPRQGFAPWWRGGRAQPQRQEGRVCWATAASWASGQVSDIKFRKSGNEWACATASLGSAGEPGGVNARFWREGGQEGAGADVVDFFPSARVSGTKLRRGSVWCTEWDPLTPARLAVGPSSSSPVVFFDVETQRLTPVVKLSGDVFSMSFLPTAAPGAGHAFVCGLRDGSVVLVDPRQPPRQNLTTTVASSLTSTSSGSGGGGCGGDGGGGGGSGSRQNARFSDPRRSGGRGASTGTELLVRLDCSSVDHTHILRDGTRCVVKDRSGGLQSVDLRFSGGPGSGPDRGRGQGARVVRPLKVLVPPGARAPAPGRFALDSTETVVVTPVPAAAAKSAAAEWGSRTSGALVTGGAWDAFSSSGGAHRAFPNTTSDVNSGVGVCNNGVGSDGGSGIGSGSGDGNAPFAGRDRLRILNVSSGEELNDIQTPWTGVSLAGERGAAAAAAAASGPGMSDSGDGVRFWGTAWEPGQGATVFEARLRSEPSGGYGRL